MFYIDDKNNIYLTKGDSGTLDITLMAGDVEYIMQEGDKLLFAVKADKNYNYALIEKESETNSIDFVETDTSEFSSIECDYSLSLVYANGNIDTFMTAKFIILGACYD